MAYNFLSLKSKKTLVGFIILCLSLIFLIILNPSKPGTKDMKPQFNLVTLADYSFPNCEVNTIPVNNRQVITDYEGIEEVNKYVSVPNNKVGLYVYPEEGLITKSAEIINTNGGDWGYVLIPYNIQDSDDEKWYKIFRGLSQLHLIPIVQLWNIDIDKDINEQIAGSTAFLDKLPWPTETRIVSVYNEVNDPAFWYGKANPEQYAEILNKTIIMFNAFDERYFILNGAFNASARSGNGYIDEQEFLYRMNLAVPGIFKKLDGWASHPYPQPAFKGSPKDKGRDSIRAYEWELDLLELYYGVTDIPVFITETGWPHAEGVQYNDDYLSEKKVAQYLETAFEDVWFLDDRIIAVTPFTIIYEPPYDHFSFIKKDGSEYKTSQALRKLPKTSGKPLLSEEHLKYVNNIGKCK
jgi:hypothetical protein